MTQDKIIRQKGDHVVYKKRGVYIIEDIRKEKIANETKCYYVLKSVYDVNASIYVPANNEELVEKMEKILSKEEIETLILQSSDVQIKCSPDAGERKLYYDEIFSEENLSVILALMKTLTKKKEEAIITKVRFSALDERTLSDCQKIVSEAFAFSLGMPKNEIVSYIVENYDK